MKQLFIPHCSLIFIVFISFFGFSDSSDCDSAELIEFGSNFLDCEIDTFIHWRSSLQKDEIICNAYTSYKRRTGIRNVLAIGFGSTVGTGLFVALAIVMGGNDMEPEYMKKYMPIHDAALIFAGVNTAIWFPGFLKYAWSRTPEERLLTNEYENSLPKKKPLLKFRSHLFTLYF